MLCPACANASTRVVDSRASDSRIRRRRECEACKHRFTTYEIEANVIGPVAQFVWDARQLVEELSDTYGRCLGDSVVDRLGQAMDKAKWEPFDGDEDD